METATQFGIITHAQIQNIDGRAFEFQPDHLLCEECWTNVDTAYAHASYYGSCYAGAPDNHGITVTKKQKAGA